MIPRNEVASMAKEAGIVDETWVMMQALDTYATLVEKFVRKQLSDEVMMTILKSDLMMPESEVDEDSDDYFKSAEFRNAVNNTVKATLFEVLQVIKGKS